MSFSWHPISQLKLPLNSLIYWSLPFLWGLFSKINLGKISRFSNYFNTISYNWNIDLSYLAYYDSSLKAQIYLNTGWSSALNKNGQKILTQEAEVVLAHELGGYQVSEIAPTSKMNCLSIVFFYLQEILIVSLCFANRYIIGFTLPTYQPTYEWP